MDTFDCIAVIGACEPERRAYARALAAATGSRLVTGIEAIAGGWLDGGRFDAAGPSVIDVPLTVPPAHAANTVEEADGTEVICVADAVHLLDDLSAEHPLIADAEDLVPLGQAGSRALHAAQGIEYATLITLVNWEELSTARLSLLLALVAPLSPWARLRLSRGPGEDIAGTRRAVAAPHDRPGWIACLNDEHRPAMTDPHVRTVRYEQLRPFHPGRLRRVLDDAIDSGSCGTIVRSVGFCRLATRPHLVGQWEQVGSCMWLHPLDADEGDPLSLEQEIAITGIDLAVEPLFAALDAAALTDVELAAGPMEWARMPDPLPAWANLPR